MKNSILLMGLAMFMASCSGDDATTVNNENPNPEGNNVLLLKVDVETHAFEGGKVLSFEGAEDFTISTIYHEPGDFGDVTLMYDEVNDTIFSGTVVWAGLGHITYPETLEQADGFQTIQAAVPMPDVQDFELVNYPGNNFLPAAVDYAAIWHAIDNLAIVKQYRDSNPQGKVQLFYYVPSVAIGQPSEWDWIVILNDNPADVMPE